MRLSTNKIYREILCIKRHENTIVTLNEPGRFDFSAYSRRPQYRMLLSWDLLVWISIEGRIPSSFTHFITTPGLSGPLYISPDDYHTQITEYSLEAIFQGYNNSRWALFYRNKISVLISSLLDLLASASMVALSDSRTGVLGNIFPVLFQLK